MKVLMVCLGNICRSPLAEELMRVRADEMGMELTVDSCGTSAYHIGEAPDSRSQKNALENQVDLSKLRARQFKCSDFQAFDRILCMDRENLKNILALAESDSDKNKVGLLLQHLGSEAEVPDPYFGGEAGFQNVFDLVDRGCTSWVEEWQQA